jgi:transcriptional regulator with XRE-family HTH domain
MGTIGERLSEERSRLGYSQEKLAQLGGVQRRAQIRYEKGERAPDALYLARVAAAGVDVLFVVTGTPVALHQRGEELAASSTGNIKIDDLIEECVHLNVAHVEWFLQAASAAAPGYAKAIKDDLGGRRDWPRRERVKLMLRLLTQRVLTFDPKQPGRIAVVDEAACVKRLREMAASIRKDLAHLEQERRRAAGGAR